MMREAELADIEKVYNLYLQFKKESGYVAKNPNNAKIFSFLHIAIQHEDFLVMVWEKDKELVGMIIGQVIDSHVCDDIVAIEHAWFVNKAHRKGLTAYKLLGGYEYWAKEIKGADHINMVCLNQVNDLGPFYERQGYVKRETTYLKDL